MVAIAWSQCLLNVPGNNNKSHGGPLHLPCDLICNGLSTAQAFVEYLQGQYQAHKLVRERTRIGVKAKIDCNFHRQSLLYREQIKQSNRKQSTNQPGCTGAASPGTRTLTNPNIYLVRLFVTTTSASSINLSITSADLHHSTNVGLVPQPQSPMEISTSIFLPEWVALNSLAARQRCPPIASTDRKPALTRNDPVGTRTIFGGGKV